MTYTVDSEERDRARKRRGFVLLLLWLVALGYASGPLLGLMNDGVLEFAGNRYQGSDATLPALGIASVPVLLLALALRELVVRRRRRPSSLDGYREG